MKIKLITIVASLFLLSNCVSLRSTTSQHHFTSEKLKNYTKEGSSCSYSVLGLLLFGNTTVDKAAKEVEITEVVFVENRINSLFGFLVVKSCTIVKGS